MIYLFQVILFVFVAGCFVLIGMFWSNWHSRRNWRGGASAAPLFFPSIALGGGFIIYLGIDYLMLDYLRLVPGVVYIIA